MPRSFVDTEYIDKIHWDIDVSNAARKETPKERDEKIEGVRTRLETQHAEHERIRIETKQRCEESSGLTEGAAKNVLMDRLECEVRQASAAVDGKIG